MFGFWGRFLRSKIGVGFSFWGELGVGVMCFGGEDPLRMQLVWL